MGIMPPTDPRILDAMRDIEADLNALAILIEGALINQFTAKPDQFIRFENAVHQGTALGQVDDASHAEASALRQRTAAALRRHLESIRAKLVA
jgi:hypothetical protein